MLINLKEFPTLFTSPLILIPLHLKEAVDQIPRERKKVDVSSVGASAAFLLNVLVRLFHFLMKDKPWKPSTRKNLKKLFVEMDTDKHSKLEIRFQC